MLGGTLVFALASASVVRSTYEDLTGPAVSFRQSELLRGLESRLAEMSAFAALRNGFNAVDFVEGRNEGFGTRISEESAEGADLEVILVTDVAGQVVSATHRGSATEELVQTLSMAITGETTWTGIFADENGTGLLVSTPLRAPGAQTFAGHLMLFDALDDDFVLPNVSGGMEGIAFETAASVRRELIPSPFVADYEPTSLVLRPEFRPDSVLRVTTPPPAELAELQQRTMRELLVRVVAFGTIIGAVLLIWFERRLLSRMSTLGELVSSATDEGEERTTVALGGSDELSVLANRIEETLASLEEARDELAEANEALLAADRAKNSFISVVSHELRTPLTAILGFTETLRTHWAALEPDRARDFLGRMSSQASALDRMVEDLLVLSRMQSGNVRYEPEVLPLVDFLGETFRAMPSGDAVDLDGVDDVTVTADPDHLRRIVTNYVDNAFKYGSPPVRIETTHAGDQVVLRVIDDGDGVPEAFVPQLFERFTQASSGDTRESSGVGLGLSIVRQLAEHNGGRAWYERHQGQPCFAVSLPLASVTEAAEELRRLSPA